MVIELILKIWKFLVHLILLFEASSKCFIFKVYENIFTHLYVYDCRLGEGDKPFEAVVTIPKLSIKAKYTSSGVLIIIPASGGGEFSAIFGN